MKKLSADSVMKWSWVVWAVSAFYCSLFLAGLLVFMRDQESPFTRISSPLVFSWISIFLLGCLAFVIASFFTIWRTLPQNTVLKLLLVPVVGAIFPLFLLAKLIRPRELFEKIKKTKVNALKPSLHSLLRLGAIAIVIFIILPIWLVGYTGAYFVVGQMTGFVEDGLPVVATGSMYPTWPKREDLSRQEQKVTVVATAGFLKYPSGIPFIGTHDINRGDIVTFRNAKSEEITAKDGEPTGLLKRVVAVAGDTIEIRGGLFYLNGEPQREPYIARARSTFGGQFLPECTVAIVPGSEFFAMGDNRKGSGDSRHELGFVKLSDVDFVIPWKKQLGVLDKNWHDTSNDLDESAKIRMDKEKYLGLLNDERQKVGVGQLKYQTKLESSAELRGKKILEFNDLSWEATRSGYPMSRALRDAGYSNVVYGEAPSLGWYEAEELLENQFAFPETKTFLLNKDFQEVGIAEVELEIKGCPKQVTVAHFAGYIPPNYKQSDIDGWKTNLDRLKEIQPSWEQMKVWPSYNQHKEEVDRITQIISIRITRTSSIVETMESNRWLSNEQQIWIKEDLNLYNEQEKLATKLNSY